MASTRCLFGILFVLLVTTGSALAQLQPTIDNHTTSLRAAISQDPSGLVDVLVTNLGSHPARAFMVRCGAWADTQEFVPPIHEGIAPGASFDLKFSVTVTNQIDSSSNSCTSYTLAAVLFGNGQAEGDPRWVGYLRNIRRGREIELARSLPLLQRTAELTTDSGTALQTLHSASDQLKALPLTMADGSTPHPEVAIGIRAQRFEIQSDLDSTIEHWQRLSNKQRLSRELVNSELARLLEQRKQAILRLQSEHPVSQ